MQRSTSSPPRDPLPSACAAQEGSGLCGNVLGGGCSILSKQTLGDDRIHQGIAVEMGISTALGVPVLHDGEPFAVLMAMNRTAGDSFSEEDQAALNAYAQKMADALWQAAEENEQLGRRTAQRNAGPAADSP